MEQNICGCALFEGIGEDDVRRLFTCLSPRKKSYSKDTFIFRAGDPVSAVYLILSGRIHIVDEDFWGNRSILETMNPLGFFGEAYSLSGATRHLVNVLAAEDTDVLLIDPEQLFCHCPKACHFHATLIRNATRILAQKVVLLTQKMSHIMQRTTREKLASYFSLCANRENSHTFSIPYTRQQLADFLAVDRSALSHELSKMRKDGLIEFRKNQIELKKPEAIVALTEVIHDDPFRK